MLLIEEIQAHGHPNILGTHRMTFEITRDSHLSRRGDCVIGVGANKGPNDFSAGFKEACRREEAKITVHLKAEGIIETIQGSGHRNLTFSHPREIVGRKSFYTSERTVMVGADKAAFDLDRRLMMALRSPRTRLNVELIVQV